MKKFCLVAIALLASGSSLAGTQTWNFTNGGSLTSGFGNTLSLTSGTGGDQITLDVSAWASTDESCNDNGNYDNSLPDPDPCIKNAELKRWSSGLGIVNRDEFYNKKTGAPQHAIDNIKNGGGANDFDYEMVLLTFSEEVNLTGFNIGWSLCGSSSSNCNILQYSDNVNAKDADVSVLGHNGSKQDFFNTDTKWSDITNQGWQHISNYSSLAENESVSVSSPLYSTHWLVGAYNNIFGGNMSLDNDAFKLAGLTTATREPSNPGTVSAPATFGIFGALAFGLMYRRRK
ncbi:exosortase-dependent surface protein XDP1 [Glaciecola sp. MF2-115]|uniref:exosortase-dependent surface protein XDP1 n=1 Tax=Glaciecola sp. MF2-115 TaxID=3384827 RepID=UPI0039A0DC03